MTDKFNIGAKLQESSSEADLLSKEFQSSLRYFLEVSFHLINNVFFFFCFFDNSVNQKLEEDRIKHLHQHVYKRSWLFYLLLILELSFEEAVRF